MLKQPPDAPSGGKSGGARPVCRGKPFGFFWRLKRDSPGKAKQKPSARLGNQPGSKSSSHTQRRQSQFTRIGETGENSGCASGHPGGGSRQAPARRLAYGGRSIPPSLELTCPISSPSCAKPAPSRGRRHQVETHRRRPAHGQPQRLPLGRWQQDHGHLDLHPGKFEVNYEKWEFCHFLEGYCIITPKARRRCTCAAAMCSSSSRA